MSGIQSTFGNEPMPKEQAVDEEGMIKKRFGFLPTSVWYLTKSASLMRYVNDELGNGSYGDKNRKALSQFNPDVAERIIKIWSKRGDKVLDPFAGRCRALITQYLNRKYTGYEISPKAYQQLKERLETKRLVQFEHPAQVVNDDSRNIDAKDEYDLVFSCPQYWDVEDYNVAYEEKTDGQLSDLHDYTAFLKDYFKIIKKCYAALKPDKYAVWVVNDIRRDKRLVPFASDTINIFEQAGFKTHDIIINRLNSLAVMGVRSAIDNGYTPKMHEYILVFKKWA
jgi:DNA modification methylase